MRGELRADDVVVVEVPGAEHQAQLAVAQAHLEIYNTAVTRSTDEVIHISLIRTYFSN